MTSVPRPTRPALSRDYILDKALALIDDEGLENFSMRRLGAVAGADAMAFYHYFPNKAALFDGVVEAVYRDVGGPPPPSADPRERILTTVRGLRQAFLRHPETLPLVATRPANTPGLLTLVEAFLGALEDAGIPSHHALDAVTCLTVFTIGHALAQAAPARGGESESAEGLTATFPKLGAALAAGAPHDPDRQFELGLCALVDGLLQKGKKTV